MFLNKFSVLAAVVVSASLCASSSNAAWVLLDNFDGYSTGATTTATGGVWASVSDGTPNSNVVSSDKGQSLQTVGGTAWSGAESDLSGSGAAIAVDEIQTYFWQVKAYDNTGAYNSGGAWIYDFMMGLSPDVANIDEVDAWQDFGVMPYINNADTTPFINANGPGTFWAPMAPDEWYNVWAVVDNDATDPTYDLYYSAGADPATLVIAGADWRGSESGIVPGVDLNAIGFMASGQVPSEFLVDNIYYAEGEQLLSNPIPEPTALALLGLLGFAGLARRR